MCVNKTVETGFHRRSQRKHDKDVIMIKTKNETRVEPCLYEYIKTIKKQKELSIVVN